jgi:hypothetical protein
VFVCASVCECVVCDFVFFCVRVCLCVSIYSCVFV